jgi:hypothetical protein
MQIALLAAGESLVGLIIFAVTIAGWIINIVNQYSQKKPVVPPPRPRPPAPPQAQRQQNPLTREIDTFLQEQRTDRKRKRSQDRQRKEPAARQTPPPPPPQEPARRPVGGTISARHVQTSNLGAGVRDSVQEHITSKPLSRTVSQDMAPQIANSVNEHLGLFTAAGAMTEPDRKATQSQTAGDALLGMFRNPVSIKQAMVMNMILTHPTLPDRNRNGSQSHARGQ